MENEYFNSITHGRLSKNEMFERVLNDLHLHKEEEIVLTIGTDSQTHGKMKVVTVVCFHRVGKGGKFFYRTEYVEKSHSVREKLYLETQKSLELGKELTEFLFQNEMDFEIIIHVDMGSSKKGKTYELINEIMGWITAEGFTGYYKPEAGVASTIADRISK
jgi:uncharacterized protein